MSPAGHSLTEAELAVLLAAADGQSMRDHAAELGLPAHTIKWRQRRVLAKLEARTIAQAIANAYHQRILLVP